MKPLDAAQIKINDRSDLAMVLQGCNQDADVLYTFLASQCGHALDGAAQHRMEAIVES
ncbi:hypothetical protein [Litorimonas sp. WD9-15]|uniref:hypothetical protein n=1 Tax=Litorimonas sp. WD9-15 TaxID=3418716 RepID=UPI003CFE6398